MASSEQGLNYCLEGGLLVGTANWLPQSRYEYNWGSFDPRIGCNHIVCQACGAEVRHLAGVIVTENNAVDPATLYATSDWLSLPYVQSKPELEGRLYSCRCQWRMQFGCTELDPPIPESEREFSSEWRCAGHPLFSLPGEIAGVQLNSPSDIAPTIHSALAGTLTDPSQPVIKVPGYLAIRLYPLLKDAGFSQQVGDAIAAALTDPSPIVRRGALEFFYEYPDAPGAEHLSTAMQENRQLFAGHPDPTDARYDLEEHLLRVLDQRLVSGRYPDAIASARQELLSGTRRPAIVRALAPVDPDWFLDHIEHILQANPGIFKKLVYALRQFGDAEIIESLQRLRARLLVDDREIQTILSKAFQSDPERENNIRLQVFSA